MKTSLWIVIVIVSGLVGFLMGYSVSSYTGFHTAAKAPGKEVKAADQPSETSAGYGSDSGGYAVEKPASPKASPRGPAVEKSAGYGSDSGGYSAEKPATPKATRRGSSTGTSPGY